MPGSSCQCLSKTAYFPELVNKGMSPYEAMTTATEQVIAKQAKLLRSFDDTKIASCKEMLSAFHKTASNKLSRKAHTLKSPMIAEQIEEEENIVTAALRSRKRNTL